MFRATLSVTVPFPLPLAGVVSVIQGTPLLAVHAHPAFTATVAGPPDAATDIDAGWSVTVQVGGPPANPVWTMAIDASPTVTLPVRTAPMLGATVKLTLPLPVPERATTIQLTSLDAVQAQPSKLLMVIVPVPPVAAN